MQKLKESLTQTSKKALDSAWLIIKLVIPIYILADVLYYTNALEIVAPFFEPLTSFLGLPPESALAIVSGMFLNLYAGISFAAPLNLTPYQWTILAIFLGVCHSMIIESAVMKKIGISLFYSYALRFISAIVISWSATFVMSEDKILTSTHKVARVHYDTFYDMLLNSLGNAIILALKIIVIILIIIVLMEFIKSKLNKLKSLSKIFSLTAGLLLGITYGAGVLISEAKSMSRKDILFVATFLMICHSIIEDTLLFVIYGADFATIVIIRALWALAISYVIIFLYKGVKNEK